MDLLTPALIAALRANASDHAPLDPTPLVKFFNPVGRGTWLATALGADEDMLVGLADLGSGRTELASFSLVELRSVRLPGGFGIARDLAFDTDQPLSVWSLAARLTGSIRNAEAVLAQLRRPPRHELPPSANDGG